VSLYMERGGLIPALLPAIWGQGVDELCRVSLSGVVPQTPIDLGESSTHHFFGVIANEVSLVEANRPAGTVWQSLDRLWRPLDFKSVGCR